MNRKERRKHAKLSKTKRTPLKLNRIEHETRTLQKQVLAEHQLPVRPEERT